MSLTTKTSLPTYLLLHSHRKFYLEKDSPKEEVRLFLLLSLMLPTFILGSSLTLLTSFQEVTKTSNDSQSKDTTALPSL